MNRQSRRKVSVASPHIAVLVIIGLVLGGSAMALLISKRGAATDASLNPQVARIEQVDGEVGVVSADDGDEQEWTEATINAPITAGDTIEAREGSRATVALTGRRYATLDPGASLDVLTLADDRTQLALRDGTALFDLSDLGQDELFEVATPYGAVDFVEPGLYQVGYGDDGNAWVSVLSGLAQVVGLSGTGEIGAGEVLTLAAQAAAPLLLSKLAPDLAGGIVDDYYDYRYPDVYDGRYSYYDRYLEDPFYYDPYRRSASYRYVNYDVPGLYDLDRYGEWIEVGDYGRCWSPRVEAGWSPYRHGYWHNDDVWGPTWVSQERWGWAPYHYGRWANVSGGRWVWVPDRVSTRPRYSPALVAFVPISDSNHIGWVPLAPGERYVPRYYDRGFKPRYLSSRDVDIRQTYVNLSVPEAVTVVPVNRFTGLIRPDDIERVDPQWIARSRPVLDPYSVAELRQIARNQKEWKRHLKRERKLARKAERAAVVTSVAPARSPFNRRAIESLNLTTVPDRARKRQLKIERRAQNAVIVPGKAGRATVVSQTPQAEALSQIERQRRKEEKRLRKQQKRLNQTNVPVVLPKSDAQRKEEKRLRRAASKPAIVRPAPADNRQASIDLQQKQARKAQKRAEKQQRRLIEQQRQQAATRQAAAQKAAAQQAAARQAAQAQADRKAQKQARRAQRQQQKNAQVRAVPNQQAVRPVVKTRPQPRPQQAKPKAAQRAEVNRAPAVKAAPKAGNAQPNAAKAQRKAEKAQRKAARGKNN